jgi:DNA-binding transcriptional MocR family regulator
MIDTVQYFVQGKNASEIAASIEEGIHRGRIAPGATLPPVRALAERLHVSPTTVAAAFRTLRGRGILSGQGRRGTKVCHRPPLVSRPAADFARHLQPSAYGNPDPTLLPPLRSLLQRCDFRLHLYGEPDNRPKLLELAARQLEADHIPAQHLAVMGGGLDAIERVLQAHVRPGDRVAVEDPGYYEIFDLMSALGLMAEPVAMDACGLFPRDLERALKTRVVACILTPRAQNPTGAALDERRARELGTLFEKYPEVLVIEDDHAGPVAGVPVFTVCHRKSQRWAVVRSVSKSLGPDLRLAIVTGDATTIARVEGRQRLGTGWVSHILQQIVEALWEDPATDQLLRRAAATYSERRNALISALQRYGISASGRSGLNVWVPVPEEVGVVTGLAPAGWAVRGGERYRLKSPPAVRITISTLRPTEAGKLAADFARLLQPALRTHSR